MQIVILDDWDHAFDSSPQLDQLRKLGEVTIYTDKAETNEQTIRRLAPADIAIMIRERTWLDRPMIEQLPKLKFIAQTGGGAAHIDKDALANQDIGIRYTPGSSRQSVVELTFGMAIVALRKLSENDRRMRNGEWPQAAGRTLNRKRLTILGLGNIGTALVPVAKAFGMDVTAWGRETTLARASALGVDATTDLNKAIAAGDVVTIHLPLRDETRGLIQAEHLQHLKSGSVLINTSRGAIIDESALFERIRQSDIIAALDVFHEEPLPDDHPLRTQDNVILSPHIGWITDDNYENVISMCIENIKEFLITS